MKKVLLFLVIGITSITAKSQDVIVTKKGEEIKAKIMEVGLSTIKYKKSDNLNGPVFEVPKLDVFMLKYENGTKQMLVDAPVFSGTMACDQGTKDAKKYYRNGNAAARGTFFTTLLTGGVLGLIPAIITSSHTPKNENLDYPTE